MSDTTYLFFIDFRLVFSEPNNILNESGDQFSVKLFISWVIYFDESELKPASQYNTNQNQNNQLVRVKLRLTLFFDDVWYW